MKKYFNYFLVFSILVSVGLNSEIHADDTKKSKVTNEERLFREVTDEEELDESKNSEIYLSDLDLLTTEKESEIDSFEEGSTIVSEAEVEYFDETSQDLEIIKEGFLDDRYDNSAYFKFYNNGHVDISGGVVGHDFENQNLKPYWRSVTSIRFGADATVVFEGSIDWLLFNDDTISSVVFDDVDTSAVTSMTFMFSGMANVSLIDLGANFDTSNVTDMSFMFKSLGVLNNSLIELNLGDKFDTSNVTSMNEMFSNMQKIQRINLGPNFNTSKVTNMNSMFSNLRELRELNLGDKFDTSSVRTMNGMFANSRKIQTLDLGDKFNTENVEDMRSMFSGTNQLETIKSIENFNMSSVTNVERMFFGTPNLESIDLSEWTFGPKVKMNSLFEGTNFKKMILGSGIQSLKNSGLPAINLAEGDFTGRWIKADGSLIFESSNDLMEKYNGSSPTHAGTYYAEKKNYQLSYDANGGIGDVPDEITNLYLGDVIKVSFENIPSKKGHTFISWDLDGVQYKEGDTITIPAHDVVLKANYQKNEYQLSFKDEDGTSEMGNLIGYYEDEVTLPMGREIEGYDFVGWQLDSEIYLGGSQFIIPDSNLDFTSLYKIKSFLISFEIDGEIVSQVNADYNNFIAYDKIPQIPEKEGYEIQGWVFNDSGNDVIFDPLSERVISDLELRAVYTEIDDIPSEGQKPDQPKEDEDEIDLPSKEDEVEKDLPSIDENLGEKLPNTGKEPNLAEFYLILFGFIVVLIKKTKDGIEKSEKK